MRLLACLIVAPRWGYDEPKILSYAISPFCLTSADGLQIGGKSVWFEDEIDALLDTLPPRRYKNAASPDEKSGKKLVCMLWTSDVVKDQSVYSAR
jgi:hypothetical protein